MVIKQVFSAAPQRQLGAVDLSLPLVAGKPLSVKSYAPGWASYQSPAANEILKELNASLGSMGFASRYDGIIDARTAQAVKTLASIAAMPGYSGVQLASGGTAGHAGVMLMTLSTPELIAKYGYDARNRIRALAQTQSFASIVRALLKGQTPAAPSPSPSSSAPSYTPPSNTTPSAPTPPSPMDVYASPAPSPTTPTWVWGIAGGIALIGLGTATYFAWR